MKNDVNVVPNSAEKRDLSPEKQEDIDGRVRYGDYCPWYDRRSNVLHLSLPQF